MEDMIYDKMMSVQIGANRKIDSYFIHIYKLLEMDNVVESDIGQMHMEGR